MTHDAVGWRGNEPVIPELAKGKDLAEGAAWEIVEGCPVSGSLQPGQSYEHTFYDRVILDLGPNAAV